MAGVLLRCLAVLLQSLALLCVTIDAGSHRRRDKPSAASARNPEFLRGYPRTTYVGVLGQRLEVYCFSAFSRYRIRCIATRDGGGSPAKWCESGVRLPFKRGRRFVFNPLRLEDIGRYWCRTDKVASNGNNTVTSFTILTARSPDTPLIRHRGNQTAPLLLASVGARTVTFVLTGSGRDGTFSLDCFPEKHTHPPVTMVEWVSEGGRRPPSRSRHTSFHVPLSDLEKTPGQCLACTVHNALGHRTASVSLQKGGLPSLWTTKEVEKHTGRGIVYTVTMAAKGSPLGKSKGCTRLGQQKRICSKFFDPYRVFRASLSPAVNVKVKMRWSPPSSESCLAVMLWKVIVLPLPYGGAGIDLVPRVKLVMKNPWKRLTGKPHGNLPVPAKVQLSHDAGARVQLASPAALCPRQRRACPVQSFSPARALPVSLKPYPVLN